MEIGGVVDEEEGKGGGGQWGLGAKGGGEGEIKGLEETQGGAAGKGKRDGVMREEDERGEKREKVGVQGVTKTGGRGEGQVEGAEERGEGATGGGGGGGDRKDTGRGMVKDVELRGGGGGVKGEEKKEGGGGVREGVEEEEAQGGGGGEEGEVEEEEELQGGTGEERAPEGGETAVSTLSLTLHVGTRSLTQTSL